MNVRKLAAWPLLVAGCLAAPVTPAAERVLRAELYLPAPLDDVWQAWTTVEGLRSFLAPDAHVDLRVDGLYEVYFDAAAPAGEKGADGMRILALEPLRRLSFTWNAPLDQPYVRAQRTVVTLEFSALDAERTQLRFTHSGWGDGAPWDAAFRYFDVAWNHAVLPRLLYRFEAGPVDWAAPPTLEPVTTTMARVTD